MAKVKLNLSRLTRLELIALAVQIHAGITGNPNYTTPNPALVALQAAIDALTTGNGELDTIRQAAQEKTVEVDGLDLALMDIVRQLGSYVENASGGDEQKILSAGMDVRDDAAPVQMTQVMSLEAGFGDNGGEVDLNWDPIHGASSYEIQSSPDPITPDSWNHAAVSTKSSATVGGLGTGTRCWFQVRAVGANGNGPWSDPATKIVP